MHSLAIHLRAMQFYAHAAHNNASGIGFFCDHGFFGDVYEELTEHYDSIIERMLGLGVPVDAYKIAEEANKVFQNTATTELPNDAFATLLGLERELCQLIATTIEADQQSQGTVNLLASLADASEARQYKISRRLGL